MVCQCVPGPGAEPDQQAGEVRQLPAPGDMQANAKPPRESP